MNARGFSLLEALVTLVILSLIATVMMQGLSQVLALRGSVLRSEREARVALLQEAWFRESIGGALAELPGRPAVFRGDEETLLFRSAEGLEGGAGEGVEWRIAEVAGSRELQRIAAGRRWPIATLEPGGDGFRYLDGAGAWHRRWPPRELTGPPTLTDEVLPRAVAVTVASADGGRLWFASVGASPTLPGPLRVQVEGLDGRTP